ncbi:MAG: CotH kinase family protein, partial [Clostridia bacterium]|nr:CotH kinase family protein [Clostridia bacterium]
MKKVFYRKLFWLAAVVLSLLCLPALACAGSFHKDIYVQPVMPEGREEEAVKSRVLAYETGKELFLFLPSGWNGVPLTLCYPGTKTLNLEGKPFSSGSTLPSAEADSRILLTNDNGYPRYSLNVMTGAGIPAVFIETESGNMMALDRSKANLESGSLLLYGTDGALHNDVGISEMRGRGNSTYNVRFRKRAYHFHLEKKTDLCGMGKAKTYNLLADYIDISLLRNRFSMALAKQVGIPYALDSQSVNLYLNNCYNGVYLLAEQVGVNPNRVDIYDLEKATEAVNGGSLEGYAGRRVENDDRSW